ncbi:Peptidase C15 pyroglutamyl peptidase I [Penicillium verhagenii]|nr:Peptidase C15 pyroglutamyl peptidase I [Penicillium verhagenii]
MGDYGPSATSTRSTDQPSLVTPPEISVLVTGFGPFKTNPVNASYLIAKSLPDSFTFAPLALRTVVSLCMSTRTQYPWHIRRRPDLVIHIGIASPRLYYSIEYLAHRDDYNITDIDGRSGYEDGEKRWKELGLPPILSPGRAFVATKELRALEGSKGGSYPPNAHFLDTWKANASAGLDLRISHDAGHYLCDFIFYTSMALATQQGQDRNILFFHVPGASEDADIKRGREITLALIKAMVTCWVDETHSA